MDRDGTVERVTHFEELLRDPQLAGTVPDDIQDIALSDGCDALIYAWGPDQYQGLWARWADGTQARIVDETPNATIEVEGVTKTVKKLRVALGGNAHDGRATAIDHKGSIGFIANFADGTSAYLIADKPSFGCFEPSVVNSTGDGGDTSPGDGRCDTGAMVGAEHECTLRAALEEANAGEGDHSIEFQIPGDAPHLISPESPLPAITQNVIIEGAGDGVIVDGSGVASGAGLTVQGAPVTVEGLTIRAFPSHGIEVSGKVPLELDHVALTDNCGFGVSTSGTVTVTGSESAPSELLRNGAGDGCTGGGIVAAPPDDSAFSVRVSDATISDNDGPGILASSQVVLDQVSISGNAGDGVSAQTLDGGILRFHVSGGLRPVTITGNRGYGIFAGSGGVSTGDVPWTITNNGRWGIFIDLGNLHLGTFGVSARATTPHIVSNNGTGNGCRFFALDAGPTVSASPAPCGGGGIAIVNELSDDAEETLIDLAEIHDNAGPGVAVTDSFVGRRLDVQNNAGPGLAALVGPDFPSGLALRIDLGPNLIANTSGDGVFVEAGGLNIKADATITQNAGLGVHVVEGAVELAAIGQGSNSSRTITSNGQIGQMCKVAALTTDENDITVSSVACEAGGVRSEEGAVDGTNLTVTGHAGPGIESRAGATGTGNVRLDGGQLCGNTPDLVLDGTQSLTGVDTVCP
jgi:CSLREA domain-containing protein